MTREEAIKEIKKAFEPAFANYIVEALTKGATVSDREPTTKNDLGVDAVSRQAVRDTIYVECSGEKLNIDFAKVLLLQRAIKALPSVTPQEPKIIPIAEIKCDEDKLKSMVEIDLYSVIKQKYIEREVLDKIRAEIKRYQSEYDVNGKYDRIGWRACNECLQIIDKYKAESEE